MNNEIYNDKYHENREEMTRYTASTVISYLLSMMEIRSAIDIGGGIGVWIDELERQLGNKLEVGYVVDGEYISESIKLIKENFIAHDLEKRFTMNRSFDVAISLEVAEHLTKERADSFVEDLTKLSEVVLFSACIPAKQAIDHINEQPITYWEKLFEKYGFVSYDIIRPYMQDEIRVPWWYRTDIILFCKETSKWKENFDKQKLKTNVFSGVVLDEYERLVGSEQRNRRCIEKFETMFFTMNKWMENVQDGKHIADYLRDREYKNIAIYGMGYIGKTLLRELQNSEVNIVSCIDRNPKVSIPSCDIVSDIGLLSDVDVVIVTAIQDYDEIRKEIEKKKRVPIISIKSIIEEQNIKTQ